MYTIQRQTKPVTRRAKRVRSTTNINYYEIIDKIINISKDDSKDSIWELLEKVKYLEEISSQLNNEIEPLPALLDSNEIGEHRSLRQKLRERR